MRAPLSVVIPTFNAEEALPACLSALFEGVQCGLIRELIVVDGGSSDRTVEVSQESGADVVQVAPSRGGQLRVGAEKARGRWLLFLHADTVLAEGWTESVMSHMGHPDRAGYFKLRFDTIGLAPTVVSGWANLRSRVFGLPYGDQGLLIARETYAHAGGYPDVPLMEDVALALALSGRLVALPSTAETSGEKYAKAGWLRRGTRNLTILLRYFMGASPERLAADYRR
ncbi:TIGR04283 family arsenosugar biosynthesis glycosyltransferase [Shimia abyssi]|uniref:Glycosyltransferase 2-like domain-containing protein n=1 Tax=Shimia abyssi TaxID=1662395 RepID=A0A2P8FH10_9RHOB|nr:TIGR04283 family arsenosugar biosynthesis glycosyltransferase [Shimia abyssi]PSL21021.1 hypothetical protein CLV88_102140 [Shimia abyssi]